MAALAAILFIKITIKFTKITFLNQNQLTLVDSSCTEVNCIFWLLGTFCYLFRTKIFPSTRSLERSRYLGKFFPQVCYSVRYVCLSVCLYVRTLQVTFFTQLTWNFDIIVLPGYPRSLLFFVKIGSKMAAVAAILFSKNYKKIHKNYISWPKFSKIWIYICKPVV